MRARAGGAVTPGRPEAWLLLASAAGALVAYVAGLVLVGRGRTPRNAVLGLGAAIQLAPLAAPLLLSTDAWSYWAYARVSSVHGGNPYEDAPAEFPDDVAYAWMGRDWADVTSVYGPLFTGASEVVAAVTGDSPSATAWAYKALAAAAIVATMLLTARAAPRPAFAAAFVGWNPVLALHLAGGGHNDAWMACAVVAALALTAAGRRQPAGVAWAAAILLKWVPLAFFALRALEARAAGRRAGHAGFAIAAAAIAAAATWRYGLDWVQAAVPLAENAERTTRFALPRRAEQLGVPGGVAVASFAAAFAVAYAWLCVQAARGRARLALAAGLLVLASPYVAPWYLAWVVPLAALEEDRLARALALALTAYLLPQTIPL